MKIPPNVKKNSKLLIKNLIIIAIIIIIVRILGMNTWQLIGFLTLISVGMYTHTKYKKDKLTWKGSIINALKSFGMVCIFIFTITWLGKYGVIGLIIIIILISAYRLLRNKKMFVESLQTIEGMIWGKSLDKGMWKKGEMKNTKIKVVWKNEK